MQSIRVHEDGAGCADARWGREDPKEVEERFADKDGLQVKEALRGSRTYPYLSAKVATIEIMRNGKVERAYFRIPTVSVRNLRKASRHELIKDVDRSGDSARLRDFFERCFSLIHEIEYYEDMRKLPGLSIVHKYSEWLDILSLLIAFVLNLILLFTADYLHDTKSDVKPGDTEKAYLGLGVCQIVLQCLMFFNFFVGPTRIHLNAMWEKWQEEQNQDAINESRQRLSLEPPKIDPKARENLFLPLRIALPLYWTVIWWPFVQRTIFLILAWVGYYYSPIWYCFQLLQIIDKSPQLQNIVLAVTKNGRNLLLTG